MKRILGVLMGVALLAIFLVACGQEAGTGEEPETETEDPVTEEANGGDGEDANEAMPEKPDKLVLWVNNEEKQEEAIQQMTDNYTSETGIEVELIPVDMLEQVEKLDVEGPSGNGPDIIFQPHDRIGDLVIRGLVDSVDLGENESDYTESALEAIQYEGEYWGFPLVVETYAMYYNKSLVDAPNTMDELMDIAAEFTDASQDEYGFLMEANNFYYTYPFFAVNGGYVFENNQGNYNVENVGLANDGAVHGGELIQSWFDNGYIPQDLNADIMNGLFREGKVATVINGPWMVRDYMEGLGDDLGVVPLPLIEDTENPDMYNNPNSFIGVKSFMLSYYSENKEWAQDLMAYMTNYDSSMIYYDIAGEIPPRTDAMEDPIIKDDPIFSAFAEQTLYGEPMPSVPAMQQVWEPINDALNFISKGEPVDEVLSEAVETILEQIEASGALD